MTDLENKTQNIRELALNEYNKQIGLMHSTIVWHTWKRAFDAAFRAFEPIAQKHVEDTVIAYEKWRVSKNYTIVSGNKTKELYQQFLKETGK